MKRKIIRPASSEADTEWDWNRLDDDAVAFLEDDEADRERNWHLEAMRHWHLVRGAPMTGTLEDRLRMLSKMRDDQLRPSRYEQQALRLDAMCASFPPNNPPPDTLVELMRRGLGLPEGHEIGEWARHGKGSMQGGADLDRWRMAVEIDAEHYAAKRRSLGLRALARAVQDRLGEARTPVHTSFGRWRKDWDYQRAVEKHAAFEEAIRRAGI